MCSQGVAGCDLNNLVLLTHQVTGLFVSLLRPRDGYLNACAERTIVQNDP